MGHRSTGALAVSRYPFPARLILAVRKRAVFMLIPTRVIHAKLWQCRFVLGRTYGIKFGPVCMPTGANFIRIRAGSNAGVE